MVWSEEKLLCDPMLMQQALFLSNVDPDLLHKAMHHKQSSV